MDGGKEDVSKDHDLKICQLCAVDFTMYHFLRPLMEALQERGHEVVGVCSDGPLLEPIRRAGFRVEPIPFRRSLSPFQNAIAAAALARLLHRERFDILHVHTPVAALLARLVAPFARVPRVVYTAHGFYFHEGMPTWKRKLFQVLEWIPGRLTDDLFTQSQEDAETARLLGLCRTGRIIAIGNGTDPNVFFPAVDEGERRNMRLALGSDPGRVVIITIGRLVLEKGYAELLAAMRYVDAELWIVGERLGSDHARGVEQALATVDANADLAGKIRLLGRREDVPALLRAADIFVLASHREGMPRSIIEAMMTGLPVVATDIRGSREEVIHGETGLLVPVRDENALSDALVRLASDPDRCQRLGSAGLDRARRLYDERIVIRRQIEALSL